jgi:uncharacterized membrane protein YpjA
MKKVITNFFDIWTKRRSLIALLLLINLAGVAFGIYYYWQQLASAPLWSWPAIPDSPIATALFVAVMALLLFRKRVPGWLATFAIFALVKTGIWTDFVMIVWPQFFFQPSYFWYYLTLFILHAGMVLEAVVIVKYADFSPRTVLVALLLFAAGDFSDYFLGTVPWPIPFLPQGPIGLVALESFAVTIALAAGFLWKRSVK